MTTDGTAEAEVHVRRGMGAEDYCTCDEMWPCRTVQLRELARPAPVTLADLKVLLSCFGRAPDRDSLVVYQRVCEQVAAVEGRTVPWAKA